ncbi:hypothetical protein D3C85_1336760 [compost metagenome]
MCHIVVTHGWRQGDQRRPVVERPAIGDVGGGHGEEISLENLDGARAVTAQHALLGDARRQSLFGEEVFHRPLRQLNAQHTMPLPGQPGHIQGLAAERHQHLAASGQLQPRPVTLQIGIGLPLMETDLVLRPARLPELLVHDSSNNSIK